MITYAEGCWEHVTELICPCKKAVYVCVQTASCFWADWRNQCWQMHVDVCAGVRAKLGCFTGGWYAGGCELNLKAVLSLSVSCSLDGPSGRKTTLRETPNACNTTSKINPWRLRNAVINWPKTASESCPTSKLIPDQLLYNNLFWSLNKSLFWMSWSNWFASV